MAAIAHDYPAEIRDIRDAIATFLEQQVFPRHEKHAAIFEDGRRKYALDGRYSDDIWKLVTEVRMASAEAGFYGMSAPAAIGGGGLGVLAYYGAWEQVYRLCGMKYWLGHYMISHWAKGPSPVLEHITPKAQAEMLPDIMSGRKTLCFALSEPGAGSDASMIKTRATRDGDGWRLNGNKIWISNSPHADYAVVFAVTDPEQAAKKKGGISAFLLPTDAPGFQLESVIKLWGSIGGDEGLLRFDNLYIAPHQLVGTQHQGFKTAMLGVGLGRVYNMARAVGVARWALEMALDYTKVRTTFGKALKEYQGITFPLAESAAEIHAAHLMGRNAAELLDRGEAAQKELSMAKSYAAEMGVRALDRAMQTHGAIGFTNEMYLTEAFIMMKRINVADGSREILRRLVAKRLLEGDTDL
jgi:acyl-CoA dehydrogenase